MQLNKFIATCGLASRRKANHYIVDGRISVNGEIVTQLGFLVDPENDEIHCDGQKLTLPSQYRYVLLNKPAGVITSSLDGRGRKTVLDLVNSKERLFPVGRLDYDTEGVLLITNDGYLSYRLTHPKFEMTKIYEARVRGCVTKEAIRQLNEGVSINEDVIVRGEAEIHEKAEDNSLIRIQVHEGKKRQIKRMMKAVGFPVIHLERIEFAGLRIEGLKKGSWRELTEEEVETLYQLTGLENG